MKILLLGASSYVGSRIFLELYKYHEVIGTFHRNQLFDKFVFLDVTDKQAVLGLVSKEKPNVIIHCANNAVVRWSEEHPKEAVELNQEATRYVIEGANTVGSKVIYISSFAAILPTNPYGKIKKESEHIAKTARAGYLIIQPGVVIGLSPKTKKEGGFFSSLMENLDEKKPAEYDMINSYQFTYLGHICEVVKIILERNIWDEIVPIAVPELKTKYELAEDILTPFGVEVRGAQSGRPASVKGKQDLHELKELGLPTYTYTQIINKTIEDIKRREQFVLD